MDAIIFDQGTFGLSKVAVRVDIDLELVERTRSHFAIDDDGACLTTASLAVTYIDGNEPQLIAASRARGRIAHVFAVRTDGDIAAAKHLATVGQIDRG